MFGDEEEWYSQFEDEGLYSQLGDGGDFYEAERHWECDQMGDTVQCGHELAETAVE
jgi:hypothetical protein